ncbi:hypothetical protein CVT24_011662 [Panaeolus cyanescens]|uniref:Uncharacterized protein n=1 Tax=Panaeolus cyanescens TaxID=181874 RepID=A0A409YH42_9AGAR|nr:hypothetical protein CVT24_011662 [Panaeolus cyanescens]
MASSKQNCMKTPQSFWGAYNTPTVTLVTTMWDSLIPEKRAAAAERFERLVADHCQWGEWSEHGSKCLKFENTFESAISILNSAVGRAKRQSFARPVRGYGLFNARTGMLLVEELLRDRINCLHQERQRIDDDLRDPVNQENKELQQILTEGRKNASDLLERFTSELEQYTSDHKLSRGWF